MQVLIEFAFCLVLFFLWIFLDRLRAKSIRLDLKGWTELLWGVFFLFVGSILNLTENIPYLSKFLTLGQTDLSTILKVGFYILGIILVLISPLNWLDVLLDRRMKDEDDETREKFMRSLINDLRIKTAVPDLFDTAFPEIIGFLNAQKGAAFLISNGELVLAASYGFSKESNEAMKCFKMEDDTISWCAKNKSSRIVNHFSQSEKRLTELVCDEQAVSLICSPLLNRKQNLGVLAIFNHSEFAKEDLLILSSLSEEIGEIIQYINYEREIKSRSKEVDSLLEQKESLVKLCESVSESKTGEILNRVANVGVEMIQSDSCNVFEIDWENEKAILIASSVSGLQQKSTDISEYPEIKESAEKKEIIFKKLEADEEKTKALLVLPLLIQDQLLGVMCFEFKEYDSTATEVEIDLAKSFASLTSFVLFHQRLSKSMEKTKIIPPTVEFLDKLRRDLIAISEKIQFILNKIQKEESEPELISDELRGIETLISRMNQVLTGKIEAKSQVEKEIQEEKAEETKDQRLRILAINDQQLIRDLLADMSNSLGFQMELAKDGEEGLKIFERDNFDLVIAELDLPQVSGWEISREVKRIKPDVLMILLTEWTVPPEKKMLEDYKVDFVLNKPFRLDQLNNIIQKAKDLRK